MRENSVFRCCSSTGWDTPIIPQLAPHKRWTVMDSQCHTLQCVWSFFFFSSSQDASVTQATSRVNDNVGDYNPFSSPEMVSLCVFNGTAHIIVWYDIQQEPNPLVLWKYIWKEILLQPFLQGQHSGTTIPISAAPSQPAVLQTSVEQNPKVSETNAFQRV